MKKALIALSILLVVTASIGIYRRQKYAEDSMPSIQPADEDVNTVHAANENRVESSMMESSFTQQESVETLENDSIEAETFSPEELTRLRLSVNYPGPNYMIKGDGTYPFVMDDDLGMAIQDFLDTAQISGPPQESFLSPEEASDVFTRRTVLLNTPRYSWRDYKNGDRFTGKDSNEEPDTEFNQHRLIPLGMINGELFTPDGMLQEHAEATAQYFFGDDFAFIHGGIEHIAGYYPENGIYTLDYYKLHSRHVCFVLTYDELPDRYEVTTVYVERDGDNWVTDKENGYVAINNLAEYAETLPKHQITLLKNESGFSYYAHILPVDTSTDVMN